MFPHMASIGWIQQALADPPSIDATVDRDAAAAAAEQHDLGIDQPSERVDAFVEMLPSLLEWFRHEHRDYPWRRTRDPWKVLIAEILLQRTKARYVDQLFDDFLARFPDPETVYQADEDEIFDAVETLGFGNKRTSTLTALATTLVEEHHGEVPADLESLQALPRIGPYTARACLCFAFGKPLALVDANIGVVVERIFGYHSSRRPHKDQSLYAFLDALIPDGPDLARVFNLALLDLRDAICTNPPNCADCPLNDGCLYAASARE